MGCIADKKRPLITVHCSKRTTMPSIVDQNFASKQQGVVVAEQHRPNCLTSSIVKENEDKQTYKNTKNASNGDNEWINCVVIHEAPNTKESFKDKLMHEITQLEKGEKQKQEMFVLGKSSKLIPWDNSNSDTNTVSNTRMNSEREVKGNSKPVKKKDHYT